MNLHIFSQAKEKLDGLKFKMKRNPLAGKGHKKFNMHIFGNSGIGKKPVLFFSVFFVRDWNVTH